MNNEIDNSGLKYYMNSTQRSKLGNQPTWHSNCIRATGVARPGKTARDRAKLERTKG